MKVKTKKKICLAIAIICFIVSLGIIGGIECGGKVSSAIYILVLFAIGTFASYKGGFLR